jgi:hypothetical protein
MKNISITAEKKTALKTALLASKTMDIQQIALHPRWSNGVCHTSEYVAQGINTAGNEAKNLTGVVPLGVFEEANEEVISVTDQLLPL